MSLLFTRSKSPHYVADWDTSKLPANAAYYGKPWGFYDYDATPAIAQLAYDSGKLVGFLRYAHTILDGSTWLEAAGTWVEPRYRRSKIAFTLWDRAIKHADPKHILVKVTSPKGYRLVKNLECNHPTIEFRVLRMY